MLYIYMEQQVARIPSLDLETSLVHFFRGTKARVKKLGYKFSPWVRDAIEKALTEAEARAKKSKKSKD